MRVAIAQLNQRVGDLSANVAALQGAIAHARRSRASVLVTPELSMTSSLTLPQDSAA